jgi:hypothetical protein
MTSDQARPLREELLEAIVVVRHQIEMETSPTSAEALGPTQQRRLLDELGSELTRLEAALAGLGDADL